MAAQFRIAITRAVCWSAGVVDGFLDALMGAFSGDQLSRIGPTEASLVSLRTAILGRHRRQVERALGTPPTVLGLGARVRSHGEAVIWYYPFDHARRQAIAIRFENDRARKVELIHGPK